MKQFKYVLTLANERSFSKAADVLNISQPSLSQYVKKIEKRLGLKLFERDKGEVKLTDAGRVYIELARKFLDLEHQLEVRISDIALHKAGSLIIGTAPYRAASMMPSIAKAYQNVRPGIHLVVREGTTAELEEGMQHGDFDLCLTMLPIDERIFKWEKIFEEELVLAVPCNSPQFDAKLMKARKYPAIEAKTIDGLPFIMLTDSQFMQKQLKNVMTDYSISLKIAAVVKGLEAQIEMVKAGVGLALVPSGIARFCNPTEVSFYSFVQNLPRREVIIMWRKDRSLSKIAEELKKVIHSIDW
jgi:DNA-binding transcriptional LysR family regulator